jgi:hypothetical protein
MNAFMIQEEIVRTEATIAADCNGKDSQRDAKIYPRNIKEFVAFIGYENGLFPRGADVCVFPEKVIVTSKCVR